MLKKSNFTLEHTKKLQEGTKCDPGILERMVFAFGLLEAISQTGLDFTFKGGTCLLLLLPQEKRLSTDIDILVKPGTDIEEYIEKTALIFPFISVEEQFRKERSSIEKRHFKFKYKSPHENEDLYILLDVVYDDNYYMKTITRKIDNSLIDTEEPYVLVKIPTINGIMGDKLTAFAPHSIGIRYDEGRELDIIKQFFDIATLFDVVSDFEEVKNTYKNIAKKAIKNRKLDDYNINKTLMDTFNSAIAIISKGQISNEDYIKLLKGIQGVKNHVIGKYPPSIAEMQACRVAYLVASIMVGKNELIKITDETQYSDKLIPYIQYSKLNHMKKANLLNFAYLYEAILLVESISNLTLHS